MDLSSMMNPESATDSRKPPQPTPPNDGYARDHLKSRASAEYPRVQAPPVNYHGGPANAHSAPAHAPALDDRYSARHHTPVQRQNGNTPHRGQAHMELHIPPSYSNGHSSPSSTQEHAGGYSTPHPYTPTSNSPGAPLPNVHRPTSSHSVHTPTSAHYPPQGYHQPSPSPHDSYARTLSYSQQQPQHQHQQQSQPQQQQNYYTQQPHTPLGPPPGRPSVGYRRDSPTSHGYERVSSFGPEAHPASQNSSSHSNKTNGSGLVHSQPTGHPGIDARLRDKSVSVSPKTRVEMLPGTKESELSSPPRYAGAERPGTLKRKVSDISPHASHTLEEQGRPKLRRTSSMAIDDVLNGESSASRNARIREPILSSHSRSSSTAVESPNNNNVDRASAVMEEERLGRSQASPSTNSTPESRRTDKMIPTQSPQPMSSKHRDSGPVHNASRSERQVEVQAPQIAKTTSAAAPIATEPAPQPRAELAVPRVEAKAPTPQVQPQVQPPAATSMPTTQNTEPVKQKPPRPTSIPIFAQSYRKWIRNGNGHHKPSNNAGSSEHGSQSAPPGPQPRPEASGTETLGPWEPSILNVIPSEEVVKVVSDFLFGQVVLRGAIGVGPAGGKATEGAVLEIEAKIGRLIDRNTNDRLRLPVITECIVSQSDPDIRVSFESQMSEVQHRSLNQYLNGALVSSKSAKPGASKPRVPISYEHSHETDQFYQLGSRALAELPPAVTSHFNAHPKNWNGTHVRITHDSRNGQELARIIKARVADIDVYSPRTLFDYRISVNIEMKFEGKNEDLLDPELNARGRKPDRVKDRMSYKHLAYQIDLTQVTPCDGSREKDHELEVEVSSAEIRRQGLLARDNQPNRYEELIRGFLDNVRVLVRHCQ